MMAPMMSSECQVLYHVLLHHHPLGNSILKTAAESPSIREVMVEHTGMNAC